ncbi:MAG: tetratricopeptide repeat protein [Proteobacteria bacterium]|nr:tetratricopeptide repeat protein [Pseudomonadota bacterium]
MPKLATILAILVAITATSVARAQSQPDADATAQAREHFERAERLFSIGKFEQAAARYEAAYDAAQLPEFLFNIGQCYRQLQRYDQAIFAYQKYLQEKPDALNREYVERTIAELEQKRDLEASRRLRLTEPLADPSDDRPQPVPAKPVYKRWWFITGAVVLAGAVTTGIAITRHSTPSSDLGELDFRK